MTRHRTSELTGALLDAAVAKSEGMRCVVGTNRAGSQQVAYLFTERRTDEFPDGQPVAYAPSSSWVDGGPIIQRERISLHFEYDPTHPQLWHALTHSTRLIKASVGTGQTALIAAMRAYVASKLGEEVEIP